MDICNNYTLSSLLDVVKTELSAKHLIPALFIALTIPDICCGKNTPKEKYIEWYDTWVVCGDPKPIITGNDCYNLRCSILHSGSVDDGFALSCDSRNDIHLGHIITIITDNKSGDDNKNIRININELTERIIDGAESFINQKGDVELFRLMDYGKCKS